MLRRDALRGLAATAATATSCDRRPDPARAPAAKAPTDQTAPTTAPPAAAAQAQRPKPHVLFVSIDDLNDWIGVLGGHPQARTPNIDRLAGMGTLFTNAHCAAPSCNPSRAATLTGLSPAVTGIYDNDQPFRPALPDAITLPEHLRAHGYRAIGAGKIFHGSFPDPRSWDAFWPSLCQQNPKSPGPPTGARPLNGIRGAGHFDWGPVQAAAEEMGDYAVASWVIDELGKLGEVPTFLACGLFRPHLPWYVPQRFFDRFPLSSVQLPRAMKRDLADVPELGVRMAKRKKDHKRVLKAGQWERAVQAYLASLSFADEMLGRVLDAFEASAARDNTVLVLWSDHGWHLGEKLHWRKFALWEEATRVPLMVVAPGVTTPGAVCEAPVNLLDLFPTLVDLCGVPTVAATEGRTLRPLLADAGASWPHASITTWLRGNHAARDRRYRYIRYADGSEELYDHRTDPMEFTNVAADRSLRAVKRRMRGLLPQRSAPGQPNAKDYPRAGRKCNAGREEDG